MKKNKKIVLIISVLLMVAVWAFIAMEKGSDLFHGLDLLIFILIVVLGIVAIAGMLKRDKEKKEGLLEEDELSTRIKYEAGYRAYMASMYMWLLIFILKDKFPNVESMIGGGVLLSALIFFIYKTVVKQKFNA